MSKLPDADQEMPLVSHLTELRTRLLRCVVIILLIFAGLFYFAQDIYALVAAPLRAYLPEGATMIATDVASPFLTPFKLTMVVALFLAMPVILYQVWGFIAPGLYKHEKRVAVPLLISSIILFYSGMAFAYFLVFPMIFHFFASVTPEGESLLMLASKDGKPNLVKILLGAKPKINARNAHGETALMLAALRGHVEVVRLLLDRGAEVNHGGWTALMYAAVNNRVEIARLLIGRKVDVNAIAENGTTPLMMAAREGHLQMVNLLLEHGADVNHKTKFGYTALEVAKERGMSQIAEALMKAGAED